MKKLILLYALCLFAYFAQAQGRICEFSFKPIVQDCTPPTVTDWVIEVKDAGTNAVIETITSATTAPTTAGLSFCGTPNPIPNICADESALTQDLIICFVNFTTACETTPVGDCGVVERLLIPQNGVSGTNTVGTTNRAIFDNTTQTTTGDFEFTYESELSDGSCLDASCTVYVEVFGTRDINLSNWVKMADVTIPMNTDPASLSGTDWQKFAAHMNFGTSFSPCDWQSGIPFLIAKKDWAFDDTQYWDGNSWITGTTPNSGIALRNSYVPDQSYYNSTTGEYTSQALALKFVISTTCGSGSTTPLEVIVERNYALFVSAAFPTLFSNNGNQHSGIYTISRYLEDEVRLTSATINGTTGLGTPVLPSASLLLERYQQHGYTYGEINTMTASTFTDGTMSTSKTHRETSSSDSQVAPYPMGPASNGYVTHFVESAFPSTYLLFFVWAREDASTKDFSDDKIFFDGNLVAHTNTVINIKNTIGVANVPYQPNIFHQTRGEMLTDRHPDILYTNAVHGLIFRY